MRSGADFDDVLEVARELWVLPSLGYAVRGLEGWVPERTEEVLRDYYRVNALRNARFRRQLVEAVGALNHEGIEPLLFKGALRLVDGTAVHQGYRGMGDLDLCVAPPAMTAATEALTAIGYRPNRSWALLHPHVVPMNRADVPGPLEVHVELLTRGPAKALPASAAWAASTGIAFDGVCARALSPTQQVLHSILHASVQDLAHATGALPLRQLLSLAGLARIHAGDVDWRGIEAVMHAQRLSPALESHLWLAHRLAGLDLPPGRWGGLAQRRHEARVLANFGLGWPAHLHRSLLDAFDRGYLDALYGHRDRPLPLIGAWVRHGLRLAWRNRGGVAARALARRA